MQPRSISILLQRPLMSPWLLFDPFDVFAAHRLSRLVALALRNSAACKGPRVLYCATIPSGLAACRCTCWHRCWGYGRGPVLKLGSDGSQMARRMPLPITARPLTAAFKNRVPPLP